MSDLASRHPIVFEFLHLCLVEVPDGSKQRFQAHVAVVLNLKLLLRLLVVRASLASYGLIHIGW
jgi:hypothetical protein